MSKAVRISYQKIQDNVSKKVESINKILSKTEKQTKGERTELKPSTYTNRKVNHGKVYEKKLLVVIMDLNMGESLEYLYSTINTYGARLILYIVLSPNSALQKPYVD